VREIASSNTTLASGGGELVGDLAVGLPRGRIRGSPRDVEIGDLEHVVNEQAGVGSRR